MEPPVTSTVDRDRAVALLVDAWRTGDQLTELPADARPRTVDEGYDIQDRFIAALVAAHGDAVVGWKLGAGSVKGKRDTGHGRSIAGRVLRSRLFSAGDAVPLRDRAPVTIEFETAFVLARTVEPGDAVDDPLDLIAATHLTCEFVRSRFVDRRAVGFASFAADDAGFDALVVGHEINRTHWAEAMQSLVVEVDGAERVRAAQGDDVTDPVVAFRDFVGLARQRHMTLPKGAIVSTGTMSVPFTIDGPAAIRARCLSTELAFTTTLPTA